MQISGFGLGKSERRPQGERRIEESGRTDGQEKKGRADGDGTKAVVSNTLVSVKSHRKRKREKDDSQIPFVAPLCSSCLSHTHLSHPYT